MKIAILGMGNIGGGVVDVILNNKASLENACGEALDIAYILDLRNFPEHPLADRIVHSIDPIVADREVGLAIEAMGGSHPAYEYTVACLKAGKHVVTSNKEVVANFGDEFTKIAQEMGVHYLFEASVGGGIPLIRPITSSLSSEKITNINGIVNGTTNYILTQLGDGVSFEDALADAKSRGYAEPNPTADLDAIDAQRKICILAALATGRLYDPSILCAETIRNVTPEDMAAADACGGAVKLIAHGSFDGNIDDIFAAPAFVPYTSPLSHISNVFNGVLVDASVSGELMFFGRGAGKYPTAGSILADVVAAVSNTQARISPFVKAPKETLLSPDDHICAHFVTVPSGEAKAAEKFFGSAAVTPNNGDRAGLILKSERHGDAVCRAMEFSSAIGVPVSVYRII